MNDLALALGAVAVLLGAAVAVLLVIVVTQGRRLSRWSQEHVNGADRLVRSYTDADRLAAENKVIRQENETLRHDNAVLRNENVAWCQQAVEGAS